MPEGQAARFVILFTPNAVKAQAIEPQSLIARHSLSNGRDVVVVAMTTQIEGRESDAIDASKAKGQQSFFDDLLAGKRAAENVGTGPRTFVGLHALPPVQHLVTIVEFHALSFHAIPVGGGAETSVPPGGPLDK